MSEAEIDKQLEGFRKTDGDNSSQNVDVSHSVSGPTIDNRNQLSTPLLVTIIVALSVGLAMSMSALFLSQQAKTEARVALNHAQEERISSEVTKSLAQICLAKK